MRKKKVLIFRCNSLAVGGGVENWILKVVSELKSFDFTVISLAYAKDRRINVCDLSRHLTYMELPYVKLPRGTPLPTMSSLKRVIDIANASDLVYWASPCIPSDLLIPVFSKAISVPLIVGFHSWKIFSIFTDYCLFKLLYSVDGIHTMNTYSYNIFKKVCRNSRVFLVPNGTEHNPYLKDTIEKTYSERFIVLWTGRLEHDKGADILVKILMFAIKMRSKFSELKFYICGSGSYASIIKKLSSRHKDLIAYLGFVDRDKLLEMYARANLFLSPSRIDGMPLRLLEAHAAGTPAIASAIPGNIDIIKICKSGILVKGWDAIKYARAISKIYNIWKTSPESYNRYCMSISKRTLRNFSWDVVLKKLSLILNNFIN